MNEYFWVVAVSVCSSWLTYAVFFTVARGEQGVQGERGYNGPTGLTGAPGECKCRCRCNAQPTEFGV